MLAVLALTVLVLIGAFTVNTYFGAYLETVFQVPPSGVALALFVVGIAAACGNTLGGHAADHWDSRRFLVLAIAMMIMSFVAITLLAAFAPAPVALAGVTVAIAVWALFGWSFPSVQQVRLLSIDADLAPVTLSLNSSAIYLGAGMGAALGSATARFGSLAMIGIVGAVCELVALGFLLMTMRPSTGVHPGLRQRKGGQLSLDGGLMSERDQRRFSREFKLAALARMWAGKPVSALARELGVARKCLYQWRDRYRVGGAVALRSCGRMTKAEALAMRSAQGVGSTAAAEAPARIEAGDLARARARIAELERKVGQQQVDLFFFSEPCSQSGERTRRAARLE